MKLVDPNGREIYEFDEKGKYLGIRKGSEGSPDQIAIIKGTNIIESKEYERGTIKEIKTGSGTVKDYNTQKSKSVEYKYFDVNNDDVASEIFEFAAQNSESEWAHIQFGKKGNRIGTAGEMTQDPAGSLIVKNFIDNGINVRKDIHSHPDVVPCSPNPSSGDIEYSQYAKKTYGDKAPPTYVYGKIGTNIYTRKGGNWEYVPYSYYGKSFQPTKKCFIMEVVDSIPPKITIYPLVILDSFFYRILVDFFAIKKWEGYFFLMDIKRTGSRGYSIKLMIVDSEHLEAAIKGEFNFRKRQIGLSDIEQVKCIVFGCANPIFRKEPQRLCGNSSIVENVLFSLKTKKQRHKSKGNHNEYEFCDAPPARSGTFVHYFFYKDGEFIPRFYRDVVW